MNTRNKLLFERKPLGSNLVVVIAYCSPPPPCSETTQEPISFSLTRAARWPLKRSLWWCANCRAIFAWKMFWTNGKSLTNFQNMKTKCEKNKDNFCKTATAENYEKLQVIFITDATFSHSFVNFAREKQVMRLWKVRQVRQENPVPLEVFYSNKNFLENGLSSCSLVRLCDLSCLNLGLAFIIF